MRCTVEDQFAHRFSGCGRVEHAPDTVASGHIGTINTRNRTDEWKPIFGNRSEARLPCFDRRRGKRWRNIPTHGFEPRVGTLVGCNVGGIDWHRPSARDRTDVRRAVCARK
jgi:hypothetical protein